VVTGGHTAIVTGANHGIGAATAQALARRGYAVLCAFLSVDDPDDPGTPQAYRDHRAQDCTAVVARIRDDGGRAASVEADLSGPGTPALLFDTAEAQFGPVDILVNNATGWLADTFAATSAELAGDQAVDQHGSGKAREYRRGLRSPRKSMKPIEFVR
jgi:3-oxoacyl-[acyl-carrier protein] reductase